MANHRHDNPARRDPKQPKVSPHLCDGRPIRFAQNLNKLFKAARQARTRAV